jgi:hypothetical protein
MNQPFESFDMTDSDLVFEAWATFEEFQRRIEDDPTWTLGDRIDYQTALDMLSQVLDHLDPDVKIKTEMLKASWEKRDATLAAPARVINVY